MRRKVRSAYRTSTDFGDHGHLGSGLKPREMHDGEMDFYLREFKKAGGIGAEFAAGALRVSIPLVRAGNTVYAVEASTAMRSVGEAAMMLHLSVSERTRLRVLPGDMRRASLPVKVPIIILPYESLWFNLFRGGYQINESEEERKKNDGKPRMLPCTCGVGNISFLHEHEPHCHFVKRTYFHAFLSAEYLVRSMLDNLLPKGIFIIDTPVMHKYRGWWEWMAERYNFSYEIARPYSCKNCLPDVRLGAICLHLYDKKTMPEGFREVLIGTKLG